MGYFKYQVRDIRVTARFALIGCGQCGATAILTVYQFCPASGLCEELRCIGICQGADTHCERWTETPFAPEHARFLRR